MKLVRHGLPGRERPGMIDSDGRIRDLSGLVPDIAGAALLPVALDRLRAVDSAALPVIPADTRLGPCVGQVGKLVCIGLNYADHAAEAGLPEPAEPVIFMKASSAICGPDDTVLIPRDSVKTDWEVELGVVIGQGGKYIDEADALSHVAGYCVINDLSERDWQLRRGGTWDKGKCFDTFAPLGPWLVTVDEIPDPQALPMWLEVNGERLQNGTTAKMIFGVAALVAYVSQCMSLQPGDIISTGTPAGVGMGMKPGRYLKPGDRMRLGIAGLGEQGQICAADL